MGVPLLHFAYDEACRWNNGVVKEFVLSDKCVNVTKLAARSFYLRMSVRGRKVDSIESRYSVMLTCILKSLSFLIDMLLNFMVLSIALDLDETLNLRTICS